MNGTLSVVATPIGNLEDITLRALRVLREADVVLCEDTRVTKKLLSHYDIHTPTKRYDAHTTDARYDDIFALLREGKRVALVSDAGTPTVSDPGVQLVARVRTELPHVVVEAIPGPSALTAALSVAGISAAEFVFLGFLPHKKGRQTLFAEIASSERPVVFYESPHRIMKACDSLVEVLEDDRIVVIARELTKMYEEVVRGSAKEVRSILEGDHNHQKGEFVVIVSGRA